MSTGVLLVDIIKTGTVTLIGNKVCKAIGEKDISDLVYGTGWMLLGVDIVLILQPFCTKVIKISTDIGNFADSIDKLVKTIEKVLGN